MISKIISFLIVLSVGSSIQEETMDNLYPNRPKGIIRNFFYNQEVKG